MSEVGLRRRINLQPFEGVALVGLLARTAEPIVRGFWAYDGPRSAATWLVTAGCLTFNLITLVSAALRKRARRFAFGPTWYLRQFLYGVSFVVLAAYVLPGHAFAPARGYVADSDDSLLDMLSLQVFIGCALLAVGYSVTRALAGVAAMIGILTLCMLGVHGQVNLDFLAQWSGWAVFDTIGGALLARTLSSISVRTRANPNALPSPINAYALEQSSGEQHADTHAWREMLAQLSRHATSLGHVVDVAMHDEWSISSLTPFERRYVLAVGYAVMETAHPRSGVRLDVYIDSRNISVRADFSTDPLIPDTAIPKLPETFRVVDDALALCGGLLTLVADDDSHALAVALMPRSFSSLKPRAARVDDTPRRQDLGSERGRTREARVPRRSTTYRGTAARIRASATSTRPFPHPAGLRPAGDDQLQRRFRMTLAAMVVALAVIACTVLYQRLPRRDQQPNDSVHITQPAGGSTIAFRSAVTGTVHGYSADDLWLDVRANNGDSHHPTETTCVRSGDKLSFAALYTGKSPPGDDGRAFTVAVLAARRGSPGDRALIEYAHRLAGPHEYDGLPRLPTGVRVVDIVTVVRGSS